MDADGTIQFILETQARQAATQETQALVLKAHAEAMQAHAEALRTHAEAQRRNDELFGQVARTELRLAEDIRGLKDAQAKTEERFRETDERLRDTDDRLNALISVVDKMIGRNGHAN